MTFSKIIEHLYVGDQWDAEHLRLYDPFREELIVDVRPLYWGDPHGYILDPKKLQPASKMVAKFVDEGYDSFVHCAMGLERSPFFAALVLKHLHPGRSLDRCYTDVCYARPQAYYYPEWVEILGGKSQ